MGHSFLPEMVSGPYGKLTFTWFIGSELEAKHFPCTHMSGGWWVCTLCLAGHLLRLWLLCILDSVKSFMDLVLCKSYNNWINSTVIFMLQIQSVLAIGRADFQVYLSVPDSPVGLFSIAQLCVPWWTGRLLSSSCVPWTVLELGDPQKNKCSPSLCFWKLERLLTKHFKYC